MINLINSLDPCVNAENRKIDCTNGEFVTSTLISGGADADSRMARHTAGERDSRDIGRGCGVKVFQLWRHRRRHVTRVEKI